MLTSTVHMGDEGWPLGASTVLSDRAGLGEGWGPPWILFCEWRLDIEDGVGWTQQCCQISPHSAETSGASLVVRGEGTE